jgi:hypothetical protein
VRTPRLLGHAAAVLGGGAVALLSVFTYRSLQPFGLLLAAVASLGLAWRLVVSGRPRTAASYAGGWLVVLFLVVAGRPEGDYAVTADLRGYALMGVGLALVPFGLVGLTRQR